MSRQAAIRRDSWQTENRCPIPVRAKLAALAGCCGVDIFSTLVDSAPVYPLSSSSANIARSSAVENRPACPATPPIRRAVGSCTTPRSIFPASSYCVGAIRARPVRRRKKARLLHAEWHKNVTARKLIERGSRNLLDHKPKHLKIDIAVDKARARRIRPASACIAIANAARAPPTASSGPDREPGRNNASADSRIVMSCLPFCANSGR